ncbi:hypothetical protein Goarm_009305 [Gossypium armourianum]|uniref:RNase H type-1 domain-containing protein n=1 Tax=Gossypium armourianum TaxID=34283 RepID=A0A7J9JSI7_9ROSI|nr:hypothetical protein [Gossypium armourianum]
MVGTPNTSPVQLEELIKLASLKLTGAYGGVLRDDNQLEAIKVALELGSLADWKDDVRVLLESDSQTTFCYIPREMNCRADALAKACVDRTSMFKVCW